MSKFGFLFDIQGLLKRWRESIRSFRQALLGCSMLQQN